MPKTMQVVVGEERWGNAPAQIERTETEANGRLCRWRSKDGQIQSQELGQRQRQGLEERQCCRALRREVRFVRFFDSPVRLRRSVAMATDCQDFPVLG